jgi:hypothetical protein
MFTKTMERPGHEFTGQPQAGHGALDALDGRGWMASADLRTWHFVTNVAGANGNPEVIGLETRLSPARFAGPCGRDLILRRPVWQAFE